MGTIPASENEYPSLLFAEGAAPGTPAAGLVICYAKSDGLIYCKDDAGTETAYGALPAHLADTTDAHDASAISVLDTGAHFTGTDVESVLAELYTAAVGGGIPASTVDAKGDILVGTANDTVDNLTVGTNGSRLIARSGATEGLRWLLGVPQFHKRTAGDYTINSTTFANLDTGTDLTLTGVIAGDIIRVGAMIVWGSEATTACLDVATIVGGSPVNYFGTAGGAGDFGITSWLGTTGQTESAGAPTMYALQSGDISSGSVTLRLRYRTTSATNKTLRASSTLPFLWWAENLGQ